MMNFDTQMYDITVWLVRMVNPLRFSISLMWIAGLCLLYRLVGKTFLLWLFAGEVFNCICIIINWANCFFVPSGYTQNPRLNDLLIFLPELTRAISLVMSAVGAVLALLYLYQLFGNRGAESSS